MTIDLLKNLTPEQCVKIASIAGPNIDWELIDSRFNWDGFDLIERGKNQYNTEYISQIDFRDKEVLGKGARFRMYENLNHYNISEDKLQEIYDYLDGLN